MLEELSVKDYALIDSCRLEFTPGFNVLTGETGAGKSILIDALSLVLGDKGRGDSVRSGAEEAEVTALLRVGSGRDVREWCEKYAIEPEDDTLLVRRTLKPNGRGQASVQAVPVTRGALAELSATLVDVHGQHEHQSLFKITTHRKLLDRFAGLEDRVSGFTELFQDLSETNKTLALLDEEENRITREADFLRFALEEIDAASLKEGEEDELIARQKVLAGHEDLAGSLESVLDDLAESRDGALAVLRRARRELDKASGIDSSLQSLLGRYDEAFFELEDLVDHVRHQRDAAEFDPAELSQVDDRLARIAALERKYGSSVPEILAYADDARRRLETYDNTDQERRRLQVKRDELTERLKAAASDLSRRRAEASTRLKAKAESHLTALGMSGAAFDVTLDRRRSGEGKAVVGPYGVDDVEFLLSANRGEVPKPLRSVASGGELSRVMLALKTVLSESDTIQTMIFDEVDTGIGGEVAKTVGEHLHGLSRTKQVFCITHLASIAVFADNHLKVEKRIVENRTSTDVRPVYNEDRIREVSRMLAGDSEGSASREHAARLLEERAQSDNGTGTGEWRK